MVIRTERCAKPAAARQIEARARARDLGVRVAVVEHGRRYVAHAQSQPGVTYRIERTRRGWTCECRGYTYTGCCKHLCALERRSEREGWVFGQIAPLPEQAATPRVDGKAALALLSGEEA